MSFNPFAGSAPSPQRDKPNQTLFANCIAERVQNSAKAEDTKAKYIRAVELLPIIIGKALEEIPLDLAGIAVELTDKALQRLPCSLATAKQYRRRILAAVQLASGETEERAARRAREDDWAVLRTTLGEMAQAPGTKPLTTFNSKRLISVDCLIDLARKNSMGVVDIDEVGALRLFTAASSQKVRNAIFGSIKLFLEVRNASWCEFTHLLPPIKHFERPRLVHRGQKVPDHLSDELEIMVDLVSRGTRCEATGSYFNGRNPKPYRFSALKVIRTCLDTGATPKTVVEVFDRRALLDCLRSWAEYDAKRDPRQIAAQTAEGYLWRLKALLERNGYNGTHIPDLIVGNAWIQEKLDRDGEMTEKAEAFCHRLLRERKMRLTFLSEHIRYRRLAMQLLKENPGQPKGRALEQIRALGTLAAVAALETDAAPARISNILDIPLYGPDAWYKHATASCPDAHLDIPGTHTKNGRSIHGVLDATSPLRGLPTIDWFLKEIRPLFVKDRGSKWLFPGVEDPSQPLPYNTFLRWWTARVDGTELHGMTPHFFRHGQATILAARHPGNWGLVSERIGDTEAVTRKRYAFVDSAALMRQGQNSLIDEFEGLDP
jgi:hypothetical protein